MPLVSHVEPYVPSTIPFGQYLEQMEWIFIDNKVTDADDKKASFLAACGKEDITDTLKKRYDNTGSDMIQRFKFYQRVQGPTESAEDFILGVKLQAEMCEFGDFKDIAIRDKLVCGINDPDVQQRLFDEENLTLSKTEKIIINREIAGARLVVEGVRLEMEIDCGAAVSVISSETYEGEFADISMQKCTKKMAVISGNRLVVEGQIPVQVELNGRRKTIKLIVLRSGSSFTPLLGRDWLDIFYSDWRNAFGSGASVNQLSFPASEEQIVDDVKVLAGGFVYEQVTVNAVAPSNRTGR
ncbi:uncharacterized protein LOC135710683 [Ochlerotatus camptorhynchus]|uniref:uncharacterized protein LOC135710683 n=1 Tax=Ochlerotatus camptorhynchus TaxID=644619 RepID=UPI0031D1C834